MLNEQSQNTDIFLWDVGHGLSMTIVSPFVNYASGVAISRRRVIQIDAGINGENNFNPIKHLVENRGLNVIDYFIISHPDQDHISDLTSVEELKREGKLNVIRFRRNPTIPTGIISNDTTNESDSKTIYKKMLTEYIHPFEAYNDVNPNTFGGVFIKTIHLSYEENMDINDASVVTNLIFGNTQILIPGDASSTGFGKLAEKGLLPNVENANIRILIAPHHGRESSDPADLLNYYKPNISLASAKPEDDHTDSLYSTSSDVSGFPVILQNNSTVNRKFLGTKGQGIHIVVNPHGPIIRKFSYSD